MLAWFRPGSERVKAPSWLGAMLIGPLRRSAYSSAIRALPQSPAERSFSVRAPVTFQTLLIWRWSCRLAPTPGRSATTPIPCRASSAPGPTPESWSSFGELIAPAASTTDRRAASGSATPRSTTPRQASPASPASSTSRSTSAPVRTTRFARPAAGRRKARAAFQRQPPFWFTSKKPTPSLSPSLKSSRRGMPACSQAATKASSTSQCSRCFSTRHSPPPPWKRATAGSPPASIRQWPSWAMKSGSAFSHDHSSSPVSSAQAS